MIGSLSSSFTDLVTICQRLEEGIKNGKVSKVVNLLMVQRNPLGTSKRRKKVKPMLSRLKEEYLAIGINIISSISSCCSGSPMKGCYAKLESQCKD